jgi:ABC-type enterochelin transport system permease subunit
MNQHHHNPIINLVILFALDSLAAGGLILNWVMQPKFMWASLSLKGDFSLADLGAIVAIVYTGARLYFLVKNQGKFEK